MTENVTLDKGASATSNVTFDGDPPNLWEQSEYADPTPMPAANATEAHRVAGLPDTNDSYKNFTITLQ